MAEHWKSTPRFWCKQCKIYIRDTAFEKSQHEASGKHQGNLKRFLRDIHRGNEQQQRESQKAKSEVERLRQTVSGSSSSSSAAGKDSNAPPWKRSAAPPPPPPQSERPASLEDRKKQIAQLAEMGVSIPDEFRREMALAGEWQTTSITPIQQPEEDEEGKPIKSIGVRKRKHEGVEGEEEDEERNEEQRFVSKGWGSTTRKYPGAGEDKEDLDALLESTKSIKKTKTTKEEEEEGTTKKEPAEDVPPATTIKGEDDTAAAPEANQPPSIQEESSSAAPVKSECEAEEPTPGVVFKKRKPKAIRK